MRFTPMVIVLLALLGGNAAPAAAQNACPCVPISYVWIATPCDSWNCAATALINAGGDPHVLVTPTTNEAHPWLVLKRIASGSAAVSPDAPFFADYYPLVLDAANRYQTLKDADQHPIILSSVDGGVVVAYETPGARRQRAARP